MQQQGIRERAQDDSLVQLLCGFKSLNLQISNIFEDICYTARFYLLGKKSFVSAIYKRSLVLDHIRLFPEIRFWVKQASGFCISGLAQAKIRGQLKTLLGNQNKIYNVEAQKRLTRSLAGLSDTTVVEFTIKTIKNDSFGQSGASFQT